MDDYLFGSYFTQYVELTETREDGEAPALCPFHQEQRPSWSVNLNTGRWQCFGCGQKGDVYKFEQLINDRTFPDAKATIDKFFEDHQDDGLQPIDPDLVEKWHKTLIKASRDNLKYLLERRGLTMEVIEKYKIGHDGERFTIPIYNASGVLVNVRRYSQTGKAQDKMVSYGKGYGKARLYPQDQLLQQFDDDGRPLTRLILCEGEWDTLCCISRGLPAVTATAGASSWNSRFNYRFMGKEVYICYDVDQAGKNGAKKVAEELSYVAPVHIVDLPLLEPANADITNYFVDAGKTDEEFLDLLAKSPIFVPPSQRYAHEEPENDDEIPEVTLEMARDAEYRDKRVSMLVRVSGRETAPYDIPRQVTWTCHESGKTKACERCHLSNFGEVAPEGGKQLVWKLGANTKKQNPLELIKVSNVRQQSVLKKWAHIPTDCPYPECETDSYANLEEVQIMPEEQYTILNDASRDGEGQATDVQGTLDQVAYYQGKDLATNTPYRVVAQRTVLPDSQAATFVISRATVEETEAMTYEQTPEKIAMLKVFQPTEGRTVLEQMDHIARDLTYNATKVFGREHLVVAMDFVWHSALAFYFQGDYEHRGWVEGLIVGDTAVGKSQIGRALTRHYQSGEIVNAEAASIAGLIGGLQKTANGSWHVSWGRLVLSDRKLIFLDECSGLSCDDIQKMSYARTEGIAEINKIRIERVRCRTRAIWSANPRGRDTANQEAKLLSTYPYGVTSIPELIGKPEDIRRFEFAVGAAKPDVSDDEPNKPLWLRPRVPHVYKPELCALLVRWIWTRRADQIVFERDAETLCLELAQAQGEKYSPRIPLVTGQNQRVKLARLAVAAACRVFSTDSTGEFVVVKPEHVRAAYEFLEREYSRPFWDYAGFSAVENSRKGMAERNRDDIKRQMFARPKVAYACLQYHDLKVQEVNLQLGETIDETRRLFSELHTKGMIALEGGCYRKTPVFVEILKEVVAEGGELIFDEQGDIVGVPDRAA